MNAHEALSAAIGIEKVEIAAPSLNLHPGGMEDARCAVEVCAQHRWAWRPSGGGRRPESHSEGINIAAPSGIYDLWVDELVARVGAGITLEALDALLKAEGLRLGSAAPLSNRATLGGVFASADRGLASRVGRSMADRALGLRFVDGGGRLLQAGARVVKNVAGYDLTRVHWGAAGSLGLVLDFTLRLEVRPESGRTLFFEGGLAPSLDRLTELRKKWAGDCVSEFWVSEAVARACGLSSAGLCITREGFDADLDHWQTCCAAERTVERLDVVRDSGWDSIVLRLSLGATRAAQLRAVSAPPLICDVLSGESWIFTSSEFTEAALRNWLLRNADALAGRVWVERGDLRRVKRASASHLRLKSVFDPHGLLPTAPTPLDLEALLR